VNGHTPINSANPAHPDPVDPADPISLRGLFILK
jgi:hypothetical protein